MAKEQSPCLGCPDRPPDRGCGNHGNCETYKSFRERLNKQTKEQRANEKRESMLNDFYVDGVTKSIKRQGRKI